MVGVFLCRWKSARLALQAGTHAGAGRVYRPKGPLTVHPFPATGQTPAPGEVDAQTDNSVGSQLAPTSFKRERADEDDRPTSDGCLSSTITQRCRAIPDDESPSSSPIRRTTVRSAADAPSSSERSSASTYRPTAVPSCRRCHSTACGKRHNRRHSARPHSDNSTGNGLTGTRPFRPAAGSAVHSIPRRSERSEFGSAGRPPRP